MKTIIAGKLIVHKLLGRQKLKDVSYRLMRYTLSTECEDGMLLHNVITGKLVLLNDEEKSLLTDLPSPRSDAMTDLIENHFLVPLDYDERATVHKLKLLLRHLNRDHCINTYVIYTTTNCNARCYYCFESDCSHINMDASTCDRLIDYMISHKGEKPLSLHWFGGEPLLGVARIDQICSALRAHDVSFVSSIISNGYLFTEEMVERSVQDWHLKNAQITLDGTENVYNQTKAYVSASGSPFQRVMNNIELLLQHKVFVNIRLNLDQNNLDDINELIEILKERFSEYDTINVYVAVINEDCGFDPIIRDAAATSTLFQTKMRLTDYLEEVGLAKKSQSLVSIREYGCMATNRESLVVYPDGRLYKCEHVVEEESVGHIDSPEINLSVLKEYNKTVELSRCLSCPLVPRCNLSEKCPVLSHHDESICSQLVKAYTQALADNYSHYKHKAAQDKS